MSRLFDASFSTEAVTAALERVSAFLAAEAKERHHDIAISLTHKASSAGTRYLLVIENDYFADTYLQRIADPRVSFTWSDFRKRVESAEAKEIYQHSKTWNSMEVETPSQLAIEYFAMGYDAAGLMHSLQNKHPDSMILAIWTMEDIAAVILPTNWPQRLTELRQMVRIHPLEGLLEASETPRLPVFDQELLQYAAYHRRPFNQPTGRFA